MWPALANRSLFMTSGKSKGSCWIDNQQEKNDPKYHMDLWVSTWATSLSKVARQRYLQMIGFNIGTYSFLLLQSLNWETTGLIPPINMLCCDELQVDSNFSMRVKRAQALGNGESLNLDEY